MNSSLLPPCSIAVLAITLTSCTRTVTVGLDNARFQTGYLNSKLVSPGTLLLVDREASPDKRVTLSLRPKIDNNSIEPGTGGDSLVSSATSGLSVSGALPGDAATAQLSADLAKQTSVTLKQFVSYRFEDPRFVLNDPDFAQQRSELGEQFANNKRYSFIFIAGCTKADKIDISVGTPEGKENGLKLTVAGKDYKVTYNRSTRTEWEAKSQPVFVQPRLYNLVRSGSGGTGFRFEEDRSSQVDLTGMLNNASTF